MNEITLAKRHGSVLLKLVTCQTWLKLPSTTYTFVSITFCLFSSVLSIFVEFFFNLMWISTGTIHVKSKIYLTLRKPFLNFVNEALDKERVFCCKKTSILCFLGH